LAIEKKKNSSCNHLLLLFRKKYQKLSVLTHGAPVYLCQAVKLRKAEHPARED